MTREPEDEIQEQLDAQERQMAGAHGSDTATVRSLMLVARAILRLNAKSSFLAKVNIGLTVAVLGATLLQLVFILLRR
jgi:hypothetical protein